MSKTKLIKLASIFSSIIIVILIALAYFVGNINQQTVKETISIEFEDNTSKELSFEINKDWHSESVECILPNEFENQEFKCFKIYDNYVDIHITASNKEFYLGDAYFDNSVKLNSITLENNNLTLYHKESPTISRTSGEYIFDLYIKEGDIYSKTFIINGLSVSITVVTKDQYYAKEANTLIESFSVN